MAWQAVWDNISHLAQLKRSLLTMRNYFILSDKHFYYSDHPADRFTAPDYFEKAFKKMSHSMNTDN